MSSFNWQKDIPNLQILKYVSIHYWFNWMLMTSQLWIKLMLLCKDVRLVVQYYPCVVRVKGGGKDRGDGKFTSCSNVGRKMDSVIQSYSTTPMRLTKLTTWYKLTQFSYSGDVQCFICSQNFVVHQYKYFLQRCTLAHHKQSYTIPAGRVCWTYSSQCKW